MATMPDMYAEPAEIEAWDRTLRHKAIRKLHLASWAEQEGDDTDAIKAVRAAISFLAQMTEPPSDVFPHLAKMINNIWASDRIGPEMGLARTLLIKEGEEVRHIPSPF